MENIKLICFDLDHTLITHGSWKEMGLALGISYEEDERLYKEYASGMLTYKEWNNKVLEYYMNHPHANRTDITRILSEYAYTDGVKEVISYLKNKGYQLALVSGSIDILVEMVAQDLGIEHFKANNTFVFDENDRLLQIESGEDEVMAKAEYLKDICHSLGIDIHECACIADGANDEEMFRITGHGVTFKGSPITLSAWKIITTLNDIKNIL